MVASRSGIRKLALSLLIAACAGLATCGISIAQSSSRTDIDFNAVDRWISDLADENFQVREEAQSRLLEIGTPVIPLLEKQREAGDHELRLRSIRIIGLIEHNKTERLLKGFMAGRNTLPGWTLFSRYAGDSDLQREAFVELYKVRQSTLERHESDTNQVQLLKDLLKEFAAEGYRDTPLNSHLITCVSMQVIRAMPDVSAETDLPQIRSALSQYFTQSTFDDATGENRRLGNLHQEAAIQWVRYPDPNNTELLRRISVSLRLSLPEGLPVAVRCLELERPMNPASVRMAMDLIARFGDESHIDLVSRNLDNSMVIYNPRFVGKDRSSQTVYNVQIGDLALSTMIHLAGQKYRDFGMNLIDRNFQGQPLPIRYSGFLTDEERAVAKEKWTQFRASLNTPAMERN